MDCLDEAALARAAEGSLSGAFGEAVRAHVSGCEDCRRRLETEAARQHREAVAALPATLDTNASPDQPQLLLPKGTPLGRYFVLECLGAGGVGIVYAAYDPVLDRRVAVKLLRTDGLAGSSADDAQARFLREAQAMARVSHPNVVAVHDVGTYGRQTFIAMELVEGGPLALWLKEPRPWREILRVFAEAGRGLAAVHAAGLVHRDFKPGNVLLRADGHAQVTDFGLVRVEPGRPAPLDTPLVSAASGEALTAAGALLGTPAYMAPEQFHGAAVDARSDQFALAVALYEALYGRHPFESTGTLGAQLEAIHRGPQAPPERSAAPERLFRVLARALSVDPAQRYPSVDALLRALEGAARVRRSPWLLATAAGVLLVSGAGLVTTRRAEAQRCEQVAAAARGLWDGAAKGQVRQAFTATGLPYAEDTFDRLDRQLSAYAQRWHDERAALCAEERAAAPAERLPQRQRCLDGRHRHLAALVEVLRAADLAVVERATTAAYALPSIEDCRRGAFVDTLPVGATPEAIAEAEAIAAQLARADALDAAGRYAEAVEAAGAAASRAEALGYGPLWAQALVTRGWAESILAVPAAASTLAEAGWLAMANGQDRIALRAWLRLGVLASRRKASPEEAHSWVRFAEAALIRLGVSDADRADLLQVRSGLRRVALRYDEALADAREALALNRKVLPAGHPGIAQALNEVGTVLEGMGRPAEALAAHREALALREDALGPLHPMVAITLTNLCASERSAGALERAEADCARAVALREQALGPDHPDLANTLNSLASVKSARGELEDALGLYRRALAIRRRHQPDHPAVATQLNNLGSVLRRLGPRRFDEAKAALEEAIAHCARLEGRCRMVAGAPLVHLGEIALAEGRSEAALGYFQRSVQLGEGLVGPEHPDLGAAVLGIAKARLAQAEPAAAVRAAQRALDLIRKRSIPGRVEEAQYILSRALWQQGSERERARALATEAAESLRGVAGQEQLAREVSAWRAAVSR